MQEVMTARRLSAGDEIEPEFAACRNAAQRAAQACMECANACLAAASVASLNRCLRLSLECADRCFDVAALPLRRGETDRFVLDRLLETCAQASERCASECRRHLSLIEACRACAEACEENSLACRAALWRPAQLHEHSGG